MPLHESDLDHATKKKLGIRTPRAPRQFRVEDLRREAIGVLNQVRHLDAAQRRRVLEHALKVNEV